MSQLAFEILLACVGVLIAIPLSVAGNSTTLPSWAGTSTTPPSVAGESVTLPKCDPGTYLDTGLGGQDVCRPCPPGSFMDIASRARRCKWHRICKRSETVLFNGTRTSDVVCLCQAGRGRRYHDVIDIHSYTCRPCGQGEVVQIVGNGRDKGDTGCCLGNQDAERDEQGKLHCLPPPPCDGAHPASAALPPGNVTSHESPVNSNKGRTTNNAHNFCLFMLIATLFVA